MKWLLVREDSGLKVYLSAETKVYGIGRARECYIKCQSLYSSRHHCDIIYGEDEVSVVDLASSNGTFVNGSRIAAQIPIKLKENDVIGIGVPSRIDVKSILFKVAIEVDEAPTSHHSLIEEGSRKRNSTSNDDTVPVKICRLDAENSLNGSCSINNLDVSKEKQKNTSVDLISVSLDEPTLASANKAPLLERSGSESSGRASASKSPSGVVDEKNNAEVIDLVESDDEVLAPVNNGSRDSKVESPVANGEVSLLKKNDVEGSLIINTSGYTDENDVIVISDDEDDLFSSSIPLSEKSNEAGDNAELPNQDMGEQEEKEHVPIKWECSDSEESDNEWWPKLSQSFSESFEDHLEPQRPSPDADSDQENGGACNVVGTSDNGEDEIEKPSSTRRQWDEKNDWFPVLSQDFDESDDEIKIKEEKMDDVDRNLSGDEDEVSEEELEDYDKMEDRDVRVKRDENGGEKGSIAGEDHGNNSKVVEGSGAGSATSINECAQVLEKVKISPENVSSVNKGNEENINSFDGHTVSENNESRSKEKKKSHLGELKLSLGNKKGPMIVKAPVLVKGRTCIWDGESRENSLVPQFPSSSPLPSPPSESSTTNVEVKKCSVILEDVMYGKNVAKHKTGGKFKQSSSRGKFSDRRKEKGGESLTKADKLRIKAERKLKLQKLSDKAPKEVSPTATRSKEVEVSKVVGSVNSRAHSPTDKLSPSALDARHSGKVAAKITEKNRGAFLTEFDLFSSSNAAPPKKIRQPKKSGAHEPRSTKNTPKVICDNAQASAENIPEISDEERLLEPENFGIECNASFQRIHRKEPIQEVSKSGILKQSNQNTEKKKKKVTFNDVPECKMYLVEPGSKMLPIKGKDYPLLLPPGGGMNVTLLQYPSIKTVVHDICRWNAHWLEEQRSKPDSEPPPVNLDHVVTPLVGTYNSFVDYYKCFYPILLYEMWARIYKEWDQNFSRNPVIQVLLLSQNDADGSSPDQELVCLHCQCVLSDHDMQNTGCPKAGDLVVWEFPEENGEVDGANVFQQQPVPIVSVRVFAYVEAIKRSNITPRVPINQCFGVVQQNSCLLNVTLKFKKRKHKMCLGQMGRLKVVCHLLSELRSFDALLELPKSPLMRHILNPLKQDVKTLVPGHFRLKSTILLNMLSRSPSSEALLCSQQHLAENETLNSSQKRAVAMAKMVSLSSEPRMCLIQGPPGTGKTKVIITLLMELFGFDGKTLNQQRKNNQTPKILLCAPSNAAIDNVVLKLLNLRTGLHKENRFRLVRVGRLESMNPAVRDISLQELTSKEVKNNANNNDSEALELHISTIQAKINSILLSLETVKCRNDIAAIKNIELKLVEYQQKLDEAYQARANSSNSSWSNKDMRNLELMAERNVLQCADIVATTLASSVNNAMLEAFPRREGPKQHFSCCIIDEACQSLEVDSLIPLKLGISNLVLVGDHQQLYPTVMSLVAKQNGLQTSLFERLWSTISLGGIPDDVSPLIVLNVQYRMHPEICHWPNTHIYQGILKTPDDLVMERQSPFLPYVILSLEFDQNDPNQLLNGNEAELVSKLFFAMHEKTEKRRYSIGIITPYQRQKDAIEGAMMKRKSAMGVSCESQCEVNTIDSFQGQERDVVIMSCVRSYRIGFLGEMRRINVALTRARRSLVVCGNFNSLKNHDLWNAFLSDGLSRGIVRCVSGSRIPNQRELLNLVSRGSNE